MHAQQGDQETPTAGDVAIPTTGWRGMGGETGARPKYGHSGSAGLSPRCRQRARRRLYSAACSEVDRWLRMIGGFAAARRVLVPSRGRHAIRFDVVQTHSEENLPVRVREVRGVEEWQGDVEFVRALVHRPRGRLLLQVQPLVQCAADASRAALGCKEGL